MRAQQGRTPYQSNNIQGNAPPKRCHYFESLNFFFLWSFCDCDEEQRQEQRGTHTPRRRSDPCSCVLLDAFRASPRGHPWPSARSPRFGPNADRVRAAPQPPANAASSAELRLCMYCPAGRRSKYRPHAVQNQRWLTPRVTCVSRHIKLSRPYPRNNRSGRVLA